MGLRVPVVTGLVVSQDYIMHDDLVIDSSLSIVVKKIKIMQWIIQREPRWELLKHFRRQLRYVEKRNVFWAERQRSFWKVFH